MSDVRFDFSRTSISLVFQLAGRVPTARARRACSRRRLLSRRLLRLDPDLLHLVRCGSISACSISGGWSLRLLLLLDVRLIHRMRHPEQGSLRLFRQGHLDQHQMVDVSLA